MAVAPIPVTYEYESVLYDITPEKPRNPSSDPCVVIHLRYKFRWQFKFQSNKGDDDDDDEVRFLEDPESRFLFCIPLDRLSSGGGDYIISHMLERTNMYLEHCECEYLKAQISAFASTLLLKRGNIGHQGIEIMVILHAAKVVCTETKKFTESHQHETTVQEEEEDDDLVEGVGDNFDLFVSV